MRIRIAIFLCILCVTCLMRGEQYNAAHFEVLPDLNKVNTRTIQKALDEVAAKGGGILRFEAGDYVTGTLEIPSGVGIYLERDARILGSVNPFDYSGYAPDDNRPMSGLISAENAFSKRVPLTAVDWILPWL